MKKFEFTTNFSSVVKPLVSAEKDEYLALASMVKLEDFLPKIDIEKNIDLLPIAFNACVANRVNKNGDVIDTQAATELCQSFINKQVNLEHNREKVVGVILKAGFSAFGSDEPLSEDQVKELDGPFNITLGGVVWRVVNSELADLIEEASDPTSMNYEKISASWELGFNEYNLLLMSQGERDISYAEKITEPDQIKEHSVKLKALGGDGKMNGKYVYRQVVGRIVPLGIGLTENPAADVKGIATKKTLVEKSNKKEKNISESTKTSVKKDNKVMKINSIKDITDENLKEMSASVVSEFVENELKKASEDYSQEKSKYDEAIKAADQKAAELAEQHGTLEKSFDEVKSQLEEMKAEEAEREALELFSSRMTSLDHELELSDADRGVLASQIKDLDEEGFASFMKDVKVLMSSKVRSGESQAAVYSTPKVKEKTEKTEEAAEEAAEEVIEGAVEEAEVEGEAVANTITPEEASMTDKYKNAFNLDGFNIKY
jgi:hypothetical protein|tara:strand:- start:46 stop:1512 length:1467 start_codon:yes stop_codon:yes gene_type:complete